MPTTIITSPCPLGAGQGPCILKCPSGFHLSIKMWITLERADVCVSGQGQESKWKAGQDSTPTPPPVWKNDMLVMSGGFRAEEEITVVFLMPWGTTVHLHL